MHGRRQNSGLLVCVCVSVLVLVVCVCVRVCVYLRVYVVGVRGVGLVWVGVVFRLYT